MRLRLALAFVALGALAPFATLPAFAQVEPPAQPPPAEAPAEPPPTAAAQPIEGSAVAAPVVPAPAPVPLRAFVLDAEARAVSVLDPAAAATVATLPVEGEPDGLVSTPDGTSIVVFDQGERKLTVRFGWHPKERSTLTVIDPSSLAVVRRSEIGWNLEHLVPTEDGTRLTAICSGYTSQKPEETLPREVVSLDAATGEVKGRVAIERAFGAALLAPTSDVAALYSPPEQQKKRPTVPAELRLVDVRTPALLATVAIEGSPTDVSLSADRRYVYLLERGKRDKKPEKTIRARLQVVSIAERAHVANLDVGVEARRIIPDEEAGLLYVLSDGGPKDEAGNPRGTLHVVRGDELLASVPIGPLPLFVRHSHDRSRLYVVSARSLTMVDPGEWRALAELPLEQAGGGLGSVTHAYTWDEPDHSPNDLGLTPDGRRGFVLYDTSSKLLVLDLENATTVASVTTGRGGKKFAKFLGAAALSALATAGSRMSYAPPPTGHTILVSTDLAVRKDGKFVYANNTQSNDVTVVNAETAEVVDKLPAGGRELMTFHDEKVVAVVDDTSLHLIDTETNTKAAEVEFGSRLHRVALAPDGSRALALTDLAVHVLDGTTGKSVGRIGTFKKPTDVLFVGGESGSGRR